jgi:hypothetical protein
VNEKKLHNFFHQEKLEKVHNKTKSFCPLVEWNFQMNTREKERKSFFHGTTPALHSNRPELKAKEHAR